uniref:dethiobiotin synthase n=1 Tax=Ningiella ruwaisensis TaxID=2364274 RepID=UPI0010A02AFB|nr:dethiobiotin synthase [Ningiella ruwaisensis]
MTKSIFITGTDTDVGKTFVTALLLDALNAQGFKTLGFKPISAGCTNTSEGLRNDDALNLLAAGSLDVDYSLINPIAYEPPIAPHIAASELGQVIDLEELQSHYKAILDCGADVLFIEGAGGWRLPLNNKGQYLSDFAIRNKMPVILVVGMRLGCLNHAILSYETIEKDGLHCVGWIANQLDQNMPYYQENLNTLRSLIKAPLLAEVPFAEDTGIENSVSHTARGEIKLSPAFKALLK